MKFDVQGRLGERVGTLRRRSELTQEQLATRCGYSAKFISEIERGKVNVPLVTLSTLARALGATASEVLLGVDTALPRELRTLEQLIAGRPPAQQKAIVRVLAAMGDLVAETTSIK